MPYPSGIPLAAAFSYTDGETLTHEKPIDKNYYSIIQLV
jgi:hypothetical protein